MFALFRSRLAFRLAAFFLLVSLAPILGAALLLPRIFEESTRAEFTRRHQLLAERTAALLEEHIERAQAKLRTVARLWGQETGPAGSGRGDPDALTSRLDSLVEPPDVFLELQYYSATRTPLEVVQSRQLAFDAAQRVMPDHDERNFQNIQDNATRPLVQTPLKEGLEWRSDRLTNEGGFTTLTLSVPVKHGEKVIGALAAYVDFVPFMRQRMALESGDYTIGVFDAEETGFLHFMMRNGNQEWMTHEWVSPDGWRFLVQESLAELHVILTGFRRQTWGWVGFAAAIAIVASFGLSTWITRPIERLKQAAEALERGDFTASTGIERADEIGRLGATFDRMAGSLRELDRAKSEFVSNVSHELRTPLTSMQLSLANLLDGVVGEVPQRQRTALTRVQTELERLIHMVNQLLELARLDAGAVEAVRERVELEPLARTVAGSLAPLAAEHGVEIAVEGAGAVEADPAMLHRVLLNLVDNAIKFSPDGGRVRVRLQRDGFEVQDQGPGLDPELAFASFRQGEQHGVKNPGVGLGLAIVKRLITLNGGTIRVTDASGTLLVVELPPA